MHNVLGLLPLTIGWLLSGCAGPGPPPENLAERARRVEAARIAASQHKAQDEQLANCLSASFDNQLRVLQTVGYNVRYRRNGADRSWTLGSEPKLPSKAVHFLKKIERGNRRWFSAQIYANPSGYLLAADATHEQSETSTVGRVRFQIYALVPGGYKGAWGSQTRFQREPFAISFEDAFRTPSSGDYLVAALPVMHMLPLSIQEALATCEQTSKPLSK